ncbi:MAG: hypothetical protein KC766_06935 [Myxococcales bacterium]|nr:hypothetical protein [Myxococcales bacterium]
MRHHPLLLIMTLAACSGSDDAAGNGSAGSNGGTAGAAASNQGGEGGGGSGSGGFSSGGSTNGGSTSGGSGGSAGQSSACKRGVAYGYHSEADMRALSRGVGWWYNWAFEPDQGVRNDYTSFGLEYVPMVWGAGVSTATTRRTPTNNRRS